jgi:hypothetical protein
LARYVARLLAHDGQAEAGAGADARLLDKLKSAGFI